MIDHMNLPVRNLDTSRQFYDAVLAKLGYAVVGQDGPAIGYGRDFWNFGIELHEHEFPSLHVAFSAGSREDVDAFFEVALANGATSNGKPGNRPMYGKQYYAAFVRDPDGHNIEAVFRG
ncbi:MAG: VOC family protein [Pseudomonadota bacterium]